MLIKESPTLSKYKETIADCVGLYYNRVPREDIYKAIDYSIAKRFKDSNAKIVNSYKRQRVTVENEHGERVPGFQDATQNITLLKLSDYIMSREPIVTPYGTLFRHHGTISNPLMDTVQSFLDLRSKHKKQMFQYSKGSEDFEKYNLLQSLDKIDSNGIYGTIGMYSALVYNNNVATSITSAGRMAVSSMTLHFEMFLNNNVKYGSLDEVLESIRHICNERYERKFDDRLILSHIPSVEECFAKVILSCGYRWIPNDKEMDIIWQTLNNLEQEDITRIYYKNNLFEFANNDRISNLITGMLKKLKRPFYTSSDVPPEIADDLNYLLELMMEYVYYKYMYIDRIDRCVNMIRSVVMVSDTDSTIISTDGWYRFIAEKIKGEELRIANFCKDPVTFTDRDEYSGEFEDKPWQKVVNFVPRKVDYDFAKDEIIERDEYNLEVDDFSANDNVRYSIISILTYILDHTVNDYMIQMCKKIHSIKEPYHDANSCKIFAKNEFLFRRLLMTQVKKNYASLIEVQEGNMVPEDEQLDVKGIEIMNKSSKPLSTRKALKKILLEDILKAPAIDQLKFVKDIAIFEHRIIESVRKGNKEYFKPVTIKSMKAYDDPLGQQGIKASVAWNMIKPNDGTELINLEERNAINIVKVQIDRATVIKVRDTYPEVYDNILKALDDETFKKYVKNPKTGIKDKLTANEITAVALPLDVILPEWLEPFIDYDSILADNLNGFPYESVGIQRLQRNSINYTNIVQL